MDTVILAPRTIVKKESLVKEENIKMKEVDSLISDIVIPEKRFGVTDLWNIRRRGKFSTITRNII